MPSSISLTPGKRVLFLTRDPELIRKQLRGQLDLRMDELKASDLMDDINTDAMTPAWACFDHRPQDIARVEQDRERQARHAGSGVRGGSRRGMGRGTRGRRGAEHGRPVCAAVVTAGATG